MVRDDTGPALRHAGLVAQSLDRLHARAAVRRRVDHDGDLVARFSGTDSGFDSIAPDTQFGMRALDDEHRRLLHELRRSRAHPGEAVVGAGYGPGESMVFDFGSGQVCADARAVHRLCVQRELPYPTPAPVPVHRGVLRDLDVTLWDIGVAAGAYPLFDAPPDWCHAPLVALHAQRIARCTKLPLHLELARAAAPAAITPAQLRRACRAPLRELCGFLQAGLFLGWLRWGLR